MLYASGYRFRPSDCRYFYDADLQVQYVEQLKKNTDLGQVRIARIAAEPHGDHVYVLDQHYHRVLQYHIPTHSWVSRRQ
jgi:hypothetical protein